MEVEIKYSVPDEETLQRIALEHKLGDYKAGELRDKHVRDSYLDTEDLRFYRAGYACRIREVSGDLLITIKSTAGSPQTGAIYSREELETPATGEQLGSWQEGEARDLAQKIVGDRPLVELFGLSQIRRVGKLFDGSREVAELSIDQVMIGTEGDSQRFFELEIELRPDGKREDLDKLSEYLEQEYDLEPQPKSKFERALMIIQPEVKAPMTNTDTKSGGISPQDSMSEAGRKALVTNFPKMVKKEEGTIEGEDPEDLHDMRVATRRMRGAARIFGPYSSSNTLKKLGVGLRETAAVLGAVRDLDVQLDSARAFRETLPAEEQAGFDLLLSSWEDERSDARKTMLRHLESKRYSRLKDKLQKYVDQESDATPDQDEELVAFQVRHRAGSELWDHYEQVLAFETVAESASDTQIHQVRINCKYLRYSLEFFLDVLPPEAGNLIAQLAAMQDKLGEFHDAT